MPIALTITRDDYTAAELREAATPSNDADATRRMLALALVLEGYKRCEAGKLCGMDRQTLRDWVLRYNAEGIAGLGNRIAAGPKSRLTPQQDAAASVPQPNHLLLFLLSIVLAIMCSLSESRAQPGQLWGGGRLVDLLRSSLSRLWMARADRM